MTGTTKMMISRIIFCTIVIGIGSVRNAASVGKVGRLALVYLYLWARADSSAKQERIQA